MNLEKLTLEDYEQVKNLSKKYKLDVLKKNDWTSIWEKNPFIIKSQKDWTIGWKLLDPKNEIVGLIHNIPFTFYYKNRNYLAAICGNWVIDNKYRSFALDIRSKFLNQKNIDLYITNTANEISEKVMEAFKAKKISQYEYFNRMIFMLNKRKIIINYIKKFSFNKSLIEDIKSFKNILFKKTDLGISNNFSISNNFGSEFDDFNNNLKKKEILYSSKDCEWLNWKYARLINTDNLWVIKNYDSHKLTGFLVFVVNYEKNYKLKKSTVVELSFINENELKISEMIKKCILISKKLNCDLVDVIGFNKYKKNLFKKIGFVDKKINNFTFLVKNSNPEIENILFNNETMLDLSLTDGDAIFSL